jgi:methylase of polypeptide subunit release factors
MLNEQAIHDNKRNFSAWERIKLFGQVYTKPFIVCKILNDIGYKSEKILGKKILDPACGDGNFLVEVAQRIIKYSKPENLQENLKCIYGWDINAEAVKECKENLSKLVKGKNINWNISVQDSMKRYKKNETFDFIVGNPPYIRIQHLGVEQRRYIQNNYAFCKSGSTDIYIAFYELCLNVLSENGICGLITPNTFLFTETAREMRLHYAKHKNLMQITNYGDIQLFDNVTTYSAIMIFDRKQRKKFKFQKATSQTEFEKRDVSFSELQEPFWQLSIGEIKKIEGKKLKDICNIHVGITTLCDKAYIFATEEIDENFVYANTKLRGKVKIEKSILKPIIKGSKLKNSDEEIKEYVLFPYKQKNGKHAIIPENELKKQYPFAYKYLFSVKSELDKRDNGAPNSVSWYAFGRSQGLDTSFGEKIIFSPMNHKPNFVYYNKPECTFYSGYCIKYSGDVNKLLPQLNSQRMENFVSSSSRDYRGGWKAYNKKIIENFEIVCLA